VCAGQVSIDSIAGQPKIKRAFVVEMRDLAFADPDCWSVVERPLTDDRTGCVVAACFEELEVPIVHISIVSQSLTRHRHLSSGRGGLDIAGHQPDNAR
jgi:hypothetical protein